MADFTGSVAVTALAAAAGRAVESSRPDALVIDPYAEALVAGAPSTVQLPTRWPDDPASAPPAQQPLLLASLYLGVRTRFIDDMLAPAEQVVILGAGLDTRAYRLHWPDGTRIFELDHLDVLAYKASVLGTAPCDLRAVAADLAEPWRAPLAAAGFDAGTPASWVVEGLLPYLSAAAQQDTLDSIVALSAPGSRAVLERAVALPHSDDIDGKLAEFSAQTGLPMTELLARADPPDPAEVLGAAGWQAQAHSVTAVCARYGRRLALTDDGPAPEPDADRGGFVTADR